MPFVFKHSFCSIQPGIDRTAFRQFLSSSRDRKGPSVRIQRSEPKRGLKQFSSAFVLAWEKILEWERPREADRCSLEYLWNRPRKGDVFVYLALVFAFCALTYFFHPGGSTGCHVGSRSCGYHCQPVEKSVP